MPLSIKHSFVNHYERSCPPHLVFIFPFLFLAMPEVPMGFIMPIAWARAVFRHGSASCVLCVGEGGERAEGDARQHPSHLVGLAGQGMLRCEGLRGRNIPSPLKPVFFPRRGCLLFPCRLLGGILPSLVQWLQTLELIYQSLVQWLQSAKYTSRARPGGVAACMSGSVSAEGSVWYAGRDARRAHMSWISRSSRRSGQSRWGGVEARRRG